MCANSSMCDCTLRACGQCHSGVTLDNRGDEVGTCGTCSGTGWIRG